MIGKTSSGNSFKGLANYLSNSDKMEWSEIRNLNNKSPMEAAKEMELTAKLSSRVQKPVYHVSLSWKEFDNPTKDQMVQVADDFLKHMELEEHQAMMISHKDRTHPHIHIMINRVHPEKHKAWEKYTYTGEGRNRQVDKTDYQRIEEFLRTTEKQYGWQITPGKHAGEWERNFDSKAPEIWETKQGAKIEEEARQIGLSDVEGKSIHQRATEIKGELYKAESFQEFDRVLAQKNLWIKPRGQGAVITDGTYSKKASSISRGFSGNKLEEKFGQNLKEYASSRDADVDIAEGFQIVDDWATLQERSELESAHFINQREYNRAKGKLSRLERYSDELQSAQGEIRAGFTQAYENGKQAYMNFGAHIKEVGFEQAQSNLVSDPKRFGKVADHNAVVRASTAVRDFDKLQGRYSTQIVNMSKDERQNKIKTLKSKTTHYKSVVSQLSHKLLDRGMQESEAGQATSMGVRQVIAVHRALTKIAKNPAQSPISLAKEAGVFISNKIDSQAGKAISDMVINGSKYLKNISEVFSNPTGGSIKLAKNVFQSAIKQVSKTSKDMGRSL